ncbi:unnamed protein product [Hapterophycus canaliculatus]
MANYVPCVREQEIDKRSARQSYFDAKRRERDMMAYTSSEYSKERKTPINFRYNAPAPRKQQQ